MPNETDTQSDVLARICDNTRAEVATKKAALSTEALRQQIDSLDDVPRGFGVALKDATISGRYGLIAEIKKASPSGGLIRPDFDPPALARAYKAGGATCLSVLTDERFFFRAASNICKPPARRSIFRFCVRTSSSIRGRFTKAERLGRIAFC